MVFRFYSNTISKASKTVAASSVILGMVLVGFGFLIFLLPKFFATLAAMVFFVTGLGSAITGVKIFWRQNQLDKINQQQSDDYRENVRIHRDDNF